jgi:hypothetical protein
MSRPFYEAKHNREAQERVMRKLLALKGRGWKLEITPREQRSSYDALLYCPSDARMYEVKVRHYPFNGSPIELGGYMISSYKVDRMQRAANGNRWGIVIDCFDGVFVADFFALPSDVRKDWGGRRDRADPADWEICYYIPARHFKRVCDTVNHAKPEGDTLL